MPPKGGKDVVPVTVPVTINRRVIVWTEAGVPVPATVPTLSVQQVSELAAVALSLPYEDPDGLEPEFAGMTNAEVMMVRQARKAASGDDAAAERLLDRVLGRPKQSVESKTLTLKYEDLLAEEARKAAPPPVTTYDATVADVGPRTKVPDPLADDIL